MEQIIHQKQDMTYLNWTKTRRSSGTAGSFLKAYEDTDQGRIYYKLSNYDPYNGINGHECINEIIADRLLSLLGIDHLSYQLIHADIQVDEKIISTWLCASKDYKKRGDSKIALDAYYQIEKEDHESPLQFCIRKGWQDRIYEMLVVDYLILNRDRHGANIEVLRNRYDRTIRLSPLFDHGLSLYFSCRSKEDLAKEDPLADKPVQSFVGSVSAYRNLDLIPKDRFPKLDPLKQSDKEILLSGLDEAIEKEYLDKIWEMIYARWEIYESIRDQR